MYSFEDAERLYRAYLVSTEKPFSPERAAVLKTALNLHEHFTNGQIVERLRRDNPEIMPELVQMALGEMVRAGLIRKVFFGDDPVHYEHVFGHLHHDHLVCVRCGALVEFRSPQIEQAQQSIAAEHGFTVLRHSLQLMGLCPRCQAEPTAQRPEQSAVEPPPPGEVAPLSLLREGLRAKVVRIEGGSGIKQRLAALGLGVGEPVEVCQNTFAGPFLVRIKGARVALGRGMVERIFVRIPEPDAGTGR